MKKILFLAGAATLAIPAFAKNGFYLSPSVGAGMSGAKPHVETGSGISQSSVFNYNAGLNIGYQYKNWRIQRGVQYLSSEYQLNNVIWGSSFDPLNPYQTGTDKYRINYTHLGVSLQIGYIICPTKKISLVPYIGALVSYNIGAKSTYTENGVKTKTSWSGNDFGDRYKSTSVWGTASLYLEYKATKKVSIFTGPSLKYMINNFGKQFSFIPEDRWIQRNYTINLDLGVKINL